MYILREYVTNIIELAFIAKLSFNLNYKLVESWVSINLIFHIHHPPTRRKSLKFPQNEIYTPIFNSNFNYNF